jgi:hypothetical protein
MPEKNEEKNKISNLFVEGFTNGRCKCLIKNFNGDQF